MALTPTTMPVAGHTARFLRGGSGPALLYLHGAGGAAAQPFMEKLAERFDVIVPEHPGFGASADPAWFDNIHDLAYYYLEFIERLDAGAVHLVGMSLGGWIALEVAVRNTARLASLTIAGAAGIDREGIPRLDTFMLTAPELARRCFFSADLQDKAAAASEGASQAELEIQLKNQRTVAKIAWAPRWYDPHLEKWLHRIDVPAHVIWAADDEVFGVGYAEVFAELIKGARVTIVPECGHLIHVEKPDAFVAAVAGFIEGLAA